MEKPSFIQLLIEEFRIVFSGKHKMIDTVIPPMIYVMVNAWVGFTLALWGALLVALAIGVMRLVRKEPFVYAVGGLGAVVVAALIAYLTGKGGQRGFSSGGSSGSHCWSCCAWRVC